MSVPLGQPKAAGEETSQTNLMANSRDLRLGDLLVVVNHVGQRTALHIFHHHPQLIVAFLQERVEEVDDIGMGALLHDNDFVDNQLLSWLIAEIHLLNGDQGLGSIVLVDTSCNRGRSFRVDARDIDGSGCALANLLLLGVRDLRILF